MRKCRAASGWARARARQACVKGATCGSAEEPAIGIVRRHSLHFAFGIKACTAKGWQYGLEVPMGGGGCWRNAGHTASCSLGTMLESTAIKEHRSCQIAYASETNTEYYICIDLQVGAEAADLPRETVRFSVGETQIPHLRVDDVLGGCTWQEKAFISSRS